MDEVVVVAPDTDEVLQVRSVLIGAARTTTTRPWRFRSITSLTT